MTGQHQDNMSIQLVLICAGCAMCVPNTHFSRKEESKKYIQNNIYKDIFCASSSCSSYHTVTTVKLIILLCRMLVFVLELSYLHHFNPV